MHIEFIDVKYGLDGEWTYIVTHGEEEMTCCFEFVDGVFDMGREVDISVDENTQIFNWGGPVCLDFLDSELCGGLNAFTEEEDGWNFGRIWNLPLFELRLDDINLFLEIICCSSIGNAGGIKKFVASDKRDFGFGVERKIIDVYWWERQDPWGTPTLMLLLEENWFSTFTENFLFRWFVNVNLLGGNA